MMKSWKVLASVLILCTGKVFGSSSDEIENYISNLSRKMDRLISLGKQALRYQEENRLEEIECCENLITQLERRLSDISKKGWRKDKQNGAPNFINDTAELLVSQLSSKGKMLFVLGDRYEQETDTYRAYYEIEHEDFIYTFGVNIHKNVTSGHTYLFGWQNWHTNTPETLKSKIKEYVENNSKEVIYGDHDSYFNTDKRYPRRK